MNTPDLPPQPGRRRLLIALVLALGLSVLAVLAGRVALLVVVAIGAVAAALVVWMIRVFVSAQGAWAQGLYGSGDTDSEHGYADAVRRNARSRAKS
jgi:hypothetical protein